MIRLTDLAGNGSFTMGGKKFEYGKVYSNPYATAFKPVNEAEGSEDHEVSMGQNQLDTIIKMATELKAKMGEDEKEIPAWIQDHISKAENYISQAAGNYHEYGDSNEEVNEAVDFRDGKYRFYSKNGVGYLTYNGKVLSSGDYDFEGGDAYWMSHSSWGGQKAFDTGKDVIKYFKSKRITTETVNEAPAQTTGERIQNLNNRIKALKDKMASTKSSEQKNLIQQRLKNALQSLSNIKKDHGIKAPHRESVVNEVGPCWKGYKQVGMKNKNGKEVPNCVPEGKINEAGISKMFIAYLGLQKKVRELEDKQKELLQPYLAAKKSNNVTGMNKAVEALKKNQKTLEMYRRNLNTVETRYIQNLDADAEYTGEI